MDEYQDCMINSNLTEIAINYETGLTDFTAQFFRKLEARGSNSVSMKIGDKIKIDWGYKETQNYHWDVAPADTNKYITILSGASWAMALGIIQVAALTHLI